MRVADIGTGSGAIAVTLACELPEAHLCATEVSAAALAVARDNAERLGVAARIAFAEGDLALPLASFAPLTCVVANLPYIKSADIPFLPRPVAHEPPVALDGGTDGLCLYRRLAEQLPALLAPDASLFFEAASDTIPSLTKLVEEAFPTAHVEIGEDYAGFERFVAVNLR
jgi:release factor glutamine methyltransferase